MISHNRSFQLGKVQLEKWITLLWITLKTCSNLLTSNLHSVRRAYKCLELLTKTLLVSFLFVFHSHSNKRTCRMIRKRITRFCLVFDNSSFLSIVYIASASKSTSFVAWNCILMNPIQKPSSSLWPKPLMKPRCLWKVTEAHRLVSLSENELKIQILSTFKEVFPQPIDQLLCSICWVKVKNPENAILVG